MSKRILLITPVFYGVERIIKTELEKADYEVVWMENKVLKFDYHGTNSKFKLLRKIYFLLTFPRYRYIKRQLNIIDNQYFDILFAINGHIICSYLFTRLKRKNPALYSILYLWDSFYMYNWSNKLKFFNRVFTFDRLDAENFKLEYKPNFYISGENQQDVRNQYDLIFIGKFNAYRYYLLKSLLSKLQASGLKCYVILVPTYQILFHNKFIYSVLKLLKFDKEWISNYFLHFEAMEGILQDDWILKRSLSYLESQSFASASNVVLDLPFKRQTGYTHRVIEAIGNGKKLITSNIDIVKESFFNPEQIQIVDFKNTEVDSEWIKERKKFEVDIYFTNLELKPWLESILNVQVA